ncbi:unnamed protein product, partial [Mesorhabditis belari]|uniref:CX domain-containing protein n=1 Tax=Mesorhabditis belari TaxID=2138241 RepID=A0AAF3E883_9BILA
MRIGHGLNLLLVLTFSLEVESKGGRGTGRGRSRSFRVTQKRMIKRTAKSGSIERTQVFRSALLGAGAGYLVASKGRFYIQNPRDPILFEERKFYWDSQYYPINDTLPVQCVNPIDPQDPQLGRIYFSNESHAREIVWGCEGGAECCGYDCCMDDGIFSSILRLAFVIVLLALIGLLLIECIRWMIYCIAQFRTKNSFNPVSTHI